MAEENSNTLILDTGSWQTKAGLSSEETPRIVTPTICGRNKSTYLMYYGQDALNKYKDIEPTHLISRGKPTDWNNLEDFWNHVCTNELHIDLSEKAELTSYYNNTNKQTKEKTMQIFFENFNVPFYYTSSNALLTLYSSGRLNGIVLDSGDQVTSVTSLYDGSPINYTQITNNFGGRDITNYLASLLKLDEFQAINIKEKYCRLSMDLEREAEELNRTNDPVKVTLPDNKEVYVRDWAVRSIEGLFDPSIVKSDSPGIHEIVYELLLKTDFDLRRELVANLIVSGGNTNFYYFNERLTKELTTLLPTILKVKTTSNTDKMNSVWFGGSIVSSLSTFQPLMISKSEYEENGPSIVSRKCV